MTANYCNPPSGRVIVGVLTVPSPDTPIFEGLRELVLSIPHQPVADISFAQMMYGPQASQMDDSRWLSETLPDALPPAQPGLPVPEPEPLPVDEPAPPMPQEPVAEASDTPEDDGGDDEPADAGEPPPEDAQAKRTPLPRGVAEVRAATFLAEHPGEEFTPGQIAKAIDARGVRNLLARMTDAGKARRTCDAPVRYAAPDAPTQK